MDFSLSPEVVEFRDEIRSIVREFVTPEIADRMHTTGVFDAPELNLELGRRGILERRRARAKASAVAASASTRE